MSAQLDTHRLAEAVSARASTYMDQEFGIRTARVERQSLDVKRLALKDVTSLVCVSGRLAFYVAFSFETSLIRAVLAGQMGGVELSPEEEEMYLGDGAGDAINTVVGNTLAEFTDGGAAIRLTPPVILSEARGIGRTAKGAEVELVTHYTEKGQLCIVVLGIEESSGPVVAQGRT